jgi:uncharacterized protein (DUF1800 family)
LRPEQDKERSMEVGRDPPTAAAPAPDAAPAPAPTNPAAPAVAASSTAQAAAAIAATAASLAACGGGSGGGTTSNLSGSTDPTAAPAPPPAPTATPPSERDAARFLAQASFGPKSIDEIRRVQEIGFDAWIRNQTDLPTRLHVEYLEAQRGRDQKAGEKPRVTDEMSYEAVWQHWLHGEDQLRARVVWALLQVFVISNIAPDLEPHAMSSYLDMLARNAFGNYRTLLEEVTLHPAMGYYLNMLRSAKEDEKKGTHPNENYAREVLQLFSIGLFQLNPDGTPKVGADGGLVPTYDEAVVKGYAKAFSGWGYGLLDNTQAGTFDDYDDNDDRLWTTPMQPWPMWHSPGPKAVLDGKTLPAGQTPSKDLADALDSIFRHPNVGPFFGRQLIQRLVTSNPSPDYVRRVAAAFDENGEGVRGDMKATVRAVLLDPEARGDPAAFGPRMAKQREPVIRFANFLRALGATSVSGRNEIHYLDGSDDALGQSPLLAPTVFNFYTPNYRPPGPVSQAGLVAPEFQITTETTVVGSLNFFANLINGGGYGSGDHRLRLNLGPLADLAGDADALIDRIDLMLFARGMGSATRTRLKTLIEAIAATERLQRVRAALLVSAMSPDYVIQR